LHLGASGLKIETWGTQTLLYFREAGPRMHRTAASLIAVFAVAVVFTPFAAEAKEKKMPAPDWAVTAAKTPTPATVGDAPAVVLFDEYTITVDAQNHAVEHRREAVRILKPQGRGYSHCGLVYDVGEKVTVFHVWTLAADGKQFQAMDEDFTERGDDGDEEMQFSHHLRVVKPPASDPGAVVACETEQRLANYMSFETWGIQNSIPVVHEALDLILPPGGHYAESWRKYTPVKPVEVESNHLRWSIENMPRLDLENLHAAPSWQALAARMDLFWGDAAVKGKELQWRMLGQWGGKLQEHRTDPTPEITAKVQELVAGAPDLYTKLSRITSYIQKNVRYFIVTRGIGGLQSHYAGDIYRHHYGDCKDKTALLISMLQVIGIKGSYLAVDSERGVIDPEAPSLVGDHMITAIELPAGTNDPRLAARVKTPEGKELLIFDPTDEVTPVGLIRSALQGGWGNIYDGEQSRVLQMPVLKPETAGLERKGNFTLASDGTLSGEVKESFTGDEATYERAALKESAPKDLRRQMESSLGAHLPGLVLKEFNFEQAADLDKPVGLNLHFSVPTYAHPAGPLLLVRMRVLGSDTRTVPDVMEGKVRKVPIELGHPGRWHNSCDIALPEGFKVDEMPDPVKLDVGFASYSSAVTVEGKTLHYESDYVQRDVEVPAAKAAEFQRLQEAILSGEDGTAVLKRQ